MIIKRSIEHKLKAWKESAGRKPILLRGARQVGKTFTINKFGESYKSFIALDLERPRERELFTRFNTGKELFETILLYEGMRVDIRETLLFIDEIQNSPSAVRSLRFFYEELPELSVIAAGSLFEVFSQREGFSFPVGRVQNLSLSPVSFMEYLEAANPPLCRKLNDIRIGDDFPAEHHALLMDAFRQFAFIGGMPEAVSNFLDSGSYAELGEVYDSIFRGYVEDAEKYSSLAKAKYLSYAVDRAPLHIGERISFEKFGDLSYRSREMKEALTTLERALIVTMARPTSSLRPPLRESLRKSPKLFFVDAGLVNFRLGFKEVFPADRPLDEVYRGRIAEQIAAQEIVAQSFERPRLVFWTREKGQAEIDFLLSVSGLAVPVEVKSGTLGKLKSLTVFMDRCDHPYAVRLYGGPLRVDEVRAPSAKAFRLLSVPFYCLPRFQELVERFIAGKR